jgi:predicted RNA binding protein YcfA (HicA-like mRNA interferase family)
VADDFYRQVIKLLEAAGCFKVRTGKHQIWYSPKTKLNFPVGNPIKSRNTANGIMKQAGLPKTF